MVFWIVVAVVVLVVLGLALRADRRRRSGVGPDGVRAAKVKAQGTVVDRPRTPNSFGP